MSSASSEEAGPRRYGCVNGNYISLTEKRSSANKVIEFTLRNDSLLRIQVNLLLFCLTLFLGNLTGSLALVTFSVLALALHCIYITTSINFDTLLVVESVGIQISSKKIFTGFNYSQFLPWTTVEDVFINEVITGGTLLPHVCCQRICQRRREDQAGAIVSRIETSKRMPGVYVQGAGKPDWSRTLQTEPVLNIPGSYWLLHRQHIYKFTFKYKDPIRESREFLYKNELMKVIRRVIRCQPNQGQMSTAHLSVSYNHTFWTRQDKMFAMAKFRNRQVTTPYPEAFILTICVHAAPTLPLADFGSEQTNGDQNSLRLRQFVDPPNHSQPIISRVDSGELLPDISSRWRSTEQMRRARGSSHSELEKAKISKNEIEMSKARDADSQPIALRLSNITDQVMEGLMFTIKQDENNIRVVEEKTKMELDEVLENSENVETEAGEKCLVNSSLLRLQDLVTKIEQSSKKFDTPRSNHTATRPYDRTFLSSNVKFPTYHANSKLLARDLKSNDNDIPQNTFLEKSIPVENKFTPVKSEGSSLVSEGKGTAGNLCKSLDKDTCIEFPQRLQNVETKMEYHNSASGRNKANDNNNTKIDNHDNIDNIHKGIGTDVQIDMWKLLRDITRGAKVMVERISDSAIKNATRSTEIPSCVPRSVSCRVSMRSSK